MAIKPPRNRNSTSQVQLPLRPKRLKKRNKAEHTSAHADAFRRLVDRVWWAKGLRVLVLGCGDGEQTVSLHERLRAEFTLGIDVDANAIHMASGRQNKTLRFQVADPITWEPNQRFNLIFIQPKSPTADYIEPLCRRARSLLEAEGQLILHVPHPFDHTVTLAFWEWCTNSQYASLFAEHPRSIPIQTLDLSHRLYSLGFRSQQVDVQVLPQHFNGHEQLVDWLMEHRLPPIKSGIDPKRIEAFRSEAIPLLARHCEAQPHLYWPTAHLLAWARLP